MKGKNVRFALWIKTENTFSFQGYMVYSLVLFITIAIEEGLRRPTAPLWIKKVKERQKKKDNKNVDIKGDKKVL